MGVPLLLPAKVGDPINSPDARIRASIGFGNDCEPYVDPLVPGLNFPIAPPGVQLPSCFAIEQTRGDPGISELLERVYTGDPQTQAIAIGELERRAVDRFLERRAAAMSTQMLAEALIATGQLRLGPEAFTSPAAQAALGAALAASGGSMASPSMFGISGFAPGATIPLGFLPSVDPAMTSIGSFGGGLLGTLAGAAIGVGGQFLQQRLMQQAQEEAFKRQRDLLLLQAQLGAGSPMMLAPSAGAGAGQIVVGADGSIRVGQLGMNASLNLTDMGQVQGPVWPPGAAGSCGRGAVTVSPMDAPSLYRVGCSGSVTPRARFYALRSNGLRDLFVRVGTVNSVSPRTLTRFARRWAKQAKLSVGPRSTRRGRRRPR